MPSPASGIWTKPTSKFAAVGCTYRAINSVGDTIEFFFSENRDLPAAKRFLRKALERHGRPDRIVIDGSQTNHEAIVFAEVLLSGIEMVHMMCKRQARFAYNSRPSIAEQFEILAG